ncbi:MAG: TonB-dependent receptor [Asticcacaulis sp.]
MSKGKSYNLRLAVLLQTTAVAALVLAAPAYAQAQTDETEASDVTEVVVTGSRIRGVAAVGSNLVSLGVDDIQKSGATSTADLLKEVPQITSLGINAEGSMGPAAPSNVTRATAPNLRGIGPTATLTLLDGQRVSNAGTQGQLVDPSFLPPLALQRIEVIADGASAIYGSDAVAGVVNLIPRKRFQGLEVSARAGFADGYDEHQFGGIFGKSWEGGNLVVAADYVHNSYLSNADRDFISSDRRWFGGANGGATTCAPGNIRHGTDTYALPDGNGQNVLIGGLTAGAFRLCDRVGYDALIPEMTRKSVYAYVEQEINEDLKFFAQAFYSGRESQSSRSQFSVSNYTLPTTNAFYPTDATQAIVVNYSLAEELGPNHGTGLSDVYQVLMGVEGNAGQFRYKLSGSVGQGKEQEIQDNRINAYALDQALRSSDPNTALNVLGSPGSNNQSVLDAIQTGYWRIRGTSGLRTLSASSDGPLFSISGGDVRVAFGAEVREETFDSFHTQHSNRNSPEPVIAVSGTQRQVKAVYGEVFFPFVSASNALPFVKRLDLSVAGRWEEYSDFGTTSNPKIGVNYAPLDDLTFRASYGTSFRAPSLSEIDPKVSGSGIYQGTQTIPGRGLVQYAAVAGGNPDLKPEEATTKSFGFDWAPNYISGLKLSVTYFDIEYKDQIVDGFGQLGTYLREPQNYVGFVAYPGDSDYNRIRDLIETSGFIEPGTINYTGIAVLNARRANTDSVKVNGVDLQASHVWYTDTYGDFTLRGNATNYLTYKTQSGSGTYVSRLNNIAYPAEWSGRVTGGWEKGGLSAQVSVDYTNSYNNTFSLLLPTVKSYTKVDADLAYRFNGEGLREGLRIGLNVRNLFDKNPPVVDNGNGYDPSKASALGRVVAVTLNKKW